MRRLCVGLVAGLLVGCGGGAERSGDPAGTPAASAASGAAAATDKEGCELLTDAEVGAATGTTITGHEDAGLSGCRWRADGGLRLMLDVYTGSSVVPATCGAQRALGTGREEEVAGLGDSALWKTSGSLVVCTARAVIRFNLDNSERTVPENKAALTRLARTVLERL